MLYFLISLCSKRDVKCLKYHTQRKILETERKSFILLLMIFLCYNYYENCFESLLQVSISYGICSYSILIFFYLLNVGSEITVRVDKRKIALIYSQTTTKYISIKFFGNPIGYRECFGIYYVYWCLVCLCSQF